MTKERNKIGNEGRRGGRPARIAEDLYGDIMSGRFRPGALLPGQRELAATYAVSLATIRSAIGSLSAAGIIEVVPGKGSIVRSISTAEPQFESWLGTADTPDEMIDLLEARHAIERLHIELAAARIDEGGAAKLYAACDAMEQLVADPIRFEDADYGFHLALAEVAGNSVTTRVLRVINEPMRRTLRLTNRGYIDRFGDLSSSVGPHRKMVDAIVARDTPGALTILSDMIERSKRSVELLG